jgi:two-component system, OmpR family, response regulator CpxR
MSIIAAFSGTYCIEETAIRDIARRTHFKYVTDDDIVFRACGLSGLNEEKIRKAFCSGTPFFNRVTHEKELSVAYLKLALAETLAEDNMFITGFTSLLIPVSISDVLRICIISDTQSRVSAAGNLGITEKDALTVLHKEDGNRAAWVKNIRGENDPWDSSLYDMVLPTDKMTSEEIGDLIAETIQRDIFMLSSSAQKAIDDFALASRIELELIKRGHFYVTAEADAGAVTLTTNRNVLILKWLERNLQSITKEISGVTCVATKVGKQFYQADIVRKFDLAKPSKPFLADDRRQFMPQLSEKTVFERIVSYDRI